MNYPKILENVYSYAINNPDAIALENPFCSITKMTYKELYTKAFILSEFIKEKTNDNRPIVVYGHKDPYMIVCFLACSLSGHAYCPVDVSMPFERVESILEQTESSIMFALDDFESKRTKIISRSKIEEICSALNKEIKGIPMSCVNGDETYYIIFTSGSTGIPKGVEISSNALDNFLEWSATLGAEAPYGLGTRFLNQAPFSFDLSVMDLYTSLYCGCTLCMMNKSIQMDLSAITPFLVSNSINVMVATPSFVNMCLIDKKFNSKNIPKLKSFFFCGEILANKTAKKLLKRFPSAVIHNTYGPTESTVAVSGIRITNEVVEKYDPLPVGKAKPGSFFIISGYEKQISNNHSIGEVLICGNTLAKGYYKKKDLTNKAFINYAYEGKDLRAYRTGDLGYIENGQLFYCGRIDLQVKLNGYRIEIGDIESNILKQPFVENCSVVPRLSEGKVKALVAVIVLTNNNDDVKVVRKLLISELSKAMPSYMVPQVYEFVEKIPMTNNGKIDRKELTRIIEEDN